MMTPEISSDSSSSCDERQYKNTGQQQQTIRNNSIISRPCASPGYWLCGLLPLALCVSYFKARSTASKCHAFASTTSNQMLTVAALGMCVESLCFFTYMFVETGLLPKLLISFAPGLFTTLLYSWLLQLPLRWAFFWGFVVTFCYQNAYIHVMRGLPKCFTFGEASILVQGCMLFLMNCVLQLPQIYIDIVDLEGDEFAQLNAIMMSALFCLLITCWLLGICKLLHRVYCFYALLSLLLMSVTLLPVTEPLPIIKIFQFILSDVHRIFIISFYLALAAATIGAIYWQLRDSTQKASTSMRKIFHVVIVLVYVPGLIYQCKLLYLASGVALAAFAVLELFRILEIPPLGDVLKRSFSSFSDEKDAGLLALTPFSLLIGFSMPLWLTTCPCGNNEDSAPAANLVPLMAGVLSIGIGDTAASVVGSRIGHLRWKNSSRTLEGTFAYVITTCLAVYALFVCDFIPMSNTKWFITALAVLVTSLVEAHTNQIDNLVLPLIFYIVVSFA